VAGYSCKMQTIRQDGVSQWCTYCKLVMSRLGVSKLAPNHMSSDAPLGDA